jgi:hypothetical protein
MGWYCVCGFLNRQNIVKEETIIINRRTKQTMTLRYSVCEKCGEKKRPYVPPRPKRPPAELGDWSALEKKPGVIIRSQSRHEGGT